MAWLARLRGRREERRERRGARLAYDAASRGRLVAGFSPGSRGPIRETDSAIVLTRDRARDLARNNPFAARILDQLVGDLIGTGVMPQIVARDRAGRVVTGEGDRAEDVHAEWAAQCVSGSHLHLGGQQGLVVRCMAEAGEALVRRRPRLPEDGMAIPLQVEGLEPDYLDALKNEQLANRGRIIQGVQFSPWGKIEGYWLHQEHPSESWPISASLSSLFVPAADVAHVFEALRLGQVRGISWLHAVAIALRDLDDFHLAERIRKKGEAAITAFVQVDDEESEALFGQLVTDSDPAAEDTRPYLAHDVHGLPTETVTPGAIVFAHGGKQVVLNHPTPVAGMEEYERIALRSIAVGARITYEALSGDLSQVNWSSYRAGRITYQRGIRMLRETLIAPLLLAPVFGWFVAAAQVASRLRSDLVYVPDWTFPAFESVNRLDDIRADMLDREARLNSRQRQLRERARDPETITREIEEDEADLRARGLLAAQSGSAVSMRRDVR